MMKKVFTGIAGIGLLTGMLLLFLGGSTYDYAVSIDEGSTYIRYSGTVSMASDSVGDHFTRAMLIAEANQDDGMVYLAAANDPDGTEDINVFVEFSHDRQTWYTHASAVKDQLTTTVAWDTLDVVEGVALKAFDASPWMRLKFDGQTGNPGTTVTWSAFLVKNTGAPTRGAAKVLPKR